MHQEFAPVPGGGSQLSTAGLGPGQPESSFPANSRSSRWCSYWDCINSDGDPTKAPCHEHPSPPARWGRDMLPSLRSANPETPGCVETASHKHVRRQVASNRYSRSRSLVTHRSLTSLFGTSTIRYVRRGPPRANPVREPRYPYNPGWSG
jgi:hypothetical protein